MEKSAQSLAICIFENESNGIKVRDQYRNSHFPFLGDLYGDLYGSMSDGRP
jgi:hypothetical protein